MHAYALFTREGLRMESLTDNENIYSRNKNNRFRTPVKVFYNVADACAYAKRHGFDCELWAIEVVPAVSDNTRFLLASAVRPRYMIAALMNGTLTDAKDHYAFMRRYRRKTAAAAAAAVAAAAS